MTDSASTDRVDPGAPTGTPGLLALVGGTAWTAGCEFDAELLAASGGNRVVVLPTAAAYEHPERVVLSAAEWFSDLGAEVEGLMVVSRSDADDDGAADVVRRARFVYLSGGSSLHLRSVLKDSKVFAALRDAWLGGAVVAGTAAGAMALTDPMVDPRGGALTVGLGLVAGLAVIPHFGDVGEDAHGEKLHRSVVLAPKNLPVAGIPERTALLRDPDGRWRSVGVGSVAVYLGGSLAADGLAALG
ncbi:MAG TPA: Type 1 glutamine amidotransferase-like domain-containing protein [Acidimicrobiales bacterium]|nr:Type 1 glutamine amidotransferase-like domain-containing protein [Acidimicrobiales bacterium]